MEFEWDKGNIDKSLRRHNISDREIEDAFFDPNKVQHSDLDHSQSEPRLIIIGKSKSKNLLFISYTTRKNKIRIISARLLNKKEKYLYEKNA